MRPCEYTHTVCAGLSHLWINEKVNFRLIRLVVGNGQVFIAVDSAIFQISRNLKKKSSEMWSFFGNSFNFCKLGHCLGS